MRLCFFHGLESSPQGTKSTLLKRRYPDCIIPELPPDIHLRVQIVEKEIKKPSLLVGSSLGGLTAIMFAMKHPDRVNAMVLLAPAVGCRDKTIFTDKEAAFLETLYIPENISTDIIAGLKDELIPISAIRALVQRSNKMDRHRLHEVDDDHSLHRSLDLMLDVIARRH